ncbi:1259_t:CDS:2 [Rhizophagus irregularis]|nr:1259_t:CDS:2 [Rhizophagus irregularis]
MKYTFISRDTFNGIIECYIGNLPTSKQEKALINLNFLNKIKEVLLNPKNNTISNKNTRSWIKKKFKLKEIIPGDYRVIVAVNNNPVLAVKNMYEVLYQTHAEITQHTAKPIIARNFLSCVDHFTRFSWARALTSKRAIEVAAYLFELFHFLGSSPTILQSNNEKDDKPRENCTLIDELFAKNIYNEEDIPDTIQIYDSIEDLDSDIIDDLQDIERAVVQDQDSENNRHIVLIDPVLLDITNNTQHKILRNMARQDLQNYTNKMANQMSKGRKRIKEYQISDLVRVAVPKIDRFSVDRPTLPCKIMEKTENNKYSLGSKFGIIGVYYSASELEPLGTETFPELEVIPLNKISIREAARLQSAGLVSGGICNCKGECNSNKCRCKKAGGDCSSRCHSGHSCQNK